MQLPLLIKVPQINSDDLSVCGWHEHMLGFGDIAIPGWLVTFCYDYNIHIVVSGLFV